MIAMRKNLTKAAMLACTLALSLASVSAIAAPPTGQGTEAQAEEDLPETLDEEEMGSAGDTEESAEDTETTETVGESADETPEDTDEVGMNGNTDGKDAGQSRRTAKQLKADKGGSTEITRATMDDGDGEENADEEDMFGNEDGEDGRPAYTAPEDAQHANVSFSFNEEAASAYFSKLTYPLTLCLREVDTGRRVSLTIKSEGQILEVDKGDYAVTSLKDSGKIPLSIAEDTLHIYENTEYPVRFAANSALKMLTDFLADNIFLGVFLVFAAIFYQKAVIPRFASDVRRR